MSNQLIRARAAGGQVRALAITATAMVEEARSRHNTWPTATAALGRSLMAAALLGATLKNGETVTLRIFGDGPLGGIIAQAGADGCVRGYVQEPQTDLPPKAPGKLDVGRAVGQGHLYITKDLGLKEPYTGTSPLVSGEIAEDLTYYFAQSEQTPSVVALGVLVAPSGEVIAAGGYLIQLLPGAEEEVVKQLETNVDAVRQVSDLVGQGLRAERILETVLAGMELQVLESKEVRFDCRCSKERLGGVLVSLGWQELAEMAAQGGAELKCHFCEEVYHFNKAELEQLMQEL
ncbi:MAG: Hsp33 family molecular chaperone HslO [Clostridia bacterium]|nr:Hsp33 family molecular chaperone HslO [Clostridia bacterium]